METNGLYLAAQRNADKLLKNVKIGINFHNIVVEKFIVDQHYVIETTSAE